MRAAPKRCAPVLEPELTCLATPRRGRQVEELSAAVCFKRPVRSAYPRLCSRPLDDPVPLCAANGQRGRMGAVRNGGGVTG